MRKLLSLLLVCLSAVVMAQNKSVFQQVVKDCKTSKQMVMQIDSDLFELYLKKETSKSKKLMAEILKGVDNLNVFQFREKKQKRQSESIAKIKKLYENAGWKLFKETNNGHNTSCIVLKKDNKKILGIAYMGVQFNKISLLEFLGSNIQLKKIAELSNLMNLQGAEKLSELTGGKKSSSKQLHLSGNYVTIKNTTSSSHFKNPLYIANGHYLKPSQVSKILNKNINSITVLKGNAAVTKFGEKARNGAVIIQTKKDTNLLKDFNIATAKQLNNNIGRTYLAANNIEIDKNILKIINGIPYENFDFKNIPSEAIKTITILKGKAAIQIYGNKAKNGAIIITTKNNSIKIPTAKKLNIVQGKKLTNTNNVITLKNGSGKFNNSNPPLYIIDGKPFKDFDINKFDINKIQNIKVLKNKAATALYGSKAENGAIIITTKK